MILMQEIITVLYYGLVAWAALLLAYCFWRAKGWDREVLYLIVLVPFVLRLLHLK
jgi:ABC-type spermidine/putrescine transport system permease subunit I